MHRRFASRLSCLLVVGLLLPAGLGLLGAAWGAVPSPRGFPLIREVVPSLKGAEVQNFGVATDRRGLVYVANGGGLLIYDGAWWRLIPIGKANTAFSVGTDATGRVAVGGVDDFGYLDASADGAMRFVSLLNLLPLGERKVGQVGAVLSTPRGFLFFTADALLEWDGAKLTTIARPAAGPPYPDVYSIGNELYLTDRNGLSRRAGDRFEPVPGGDRFRDKRIDQILPADGGLLISVRGEGLFFFRPTDGSLELFAPEASIWTAANKLIGGASCRLPDGRWVFGSILGGLLFLRPDGTVEKIIDSRIGLPDNFVSGAAIDTEGGLWLSLNSAIVRVEIGSPISVVDRRSGLDGSAYAVARHLGKLWVAAPAGTYAEVAGRSSGDGLLHLAKVEGLPFAGWSLLSLDDGLLVGTAFGIYFVPDGAPPHLIPGSEAVDTAYVLARSADPRRIWVGGEGLSSLRREAAGWRYVASSFGPKSEVRSVVEGGDSVWISAPYEGVYGIDLAPSADQPGPEAPRRVRRIPDSDEVTLVRIAGRIAAIRDGRVLRLDEATATLVEDPAFAVLGAPPGEEGDFSALAEDSAGNVWRNSRPPAVFLRQGASWSAAARSMLEIPAREVEAITPEADGSVWLGTESGLFQVESPLPAAAVLPATRFARVSTGRGDFLFGGIPAPSQIELPHQLTRLQIELAPLSFRAGLRYATRLDPIDSEWSERTDPRIELTRLPAGRYTFRARTLGPNGEQSPEAVWAFRVLPAWYETSWAIALWVLVAFAGVWGWVSLRSRALRERAGELERRVQEQTAELRLTVADLEQTRSDLETANVRLEELSLLDELTGIANRRRLQMLLDAEWHRARRQHQPIAFILLDLDHFKQLNDTRGHLEGDFCLQAVAAFLAQAVQRTGDLVARYGGEEFAVLLPSTDLSGALKVAERLREGLETLALPHDTLGSYVTASLGVAALTPRLGQEPEVLIEAADLALYRAKSDGRNLVRAAGGSDEDTGEMELTN